MNKQTFLTITLTLLVFTSGIIVGNLTAGRDGLDLRAITTQTENKDNGTLGATPGATTQAGAAVAFTISIANLPDAQKALLRTMGITGDTIPITNDMLVCAEAAVGNERITEIKNGVVPSMSEGLKLAGCYQK